MLYHEACDVPRVCFFFSIASSACASFAPDSANVTARKEGSGSVLAPLSSIAAMAENGTNLYSPLANV